MSDENGRGLPLLDRTPKVYNDRMETTHHISIHSPEEDEREKATEYVFRRLAALQQYVRKICFGKDAPDERNALIRKQASLVDNCLGKAASDFCGDLSTPPKEIDLACLKDPAVCEAMLTLEEMVSATRCSRPERVKFASFGITRKRGAA